MEAEHKAFFEKAAELGELLGKPPSRIKVFFRELKRSLHNLRVYLPIIWKDRDWDQTYLYDLLAFKLRKMHTYRLNDPSYMPSVGDEKINKVILECAILADRLGSNRDFAKYYYNKVKQAREEFGKDPDEWTPVCGGLAFKHSEKPGSRKYWKALKIWGNKSREQEESAKNRLFHLLDKHIESFWD